MKYYVALFSDIKRMWNVLLKCYGCPWCVRENPGKFIREEKLNCPSFFLTVPHTSANHVCLCFSTGTGSSSSRRRAHQTHHHVPSKLSDPRNEKQSIFFFLALSFLSYACRLCHSFCSFVIHKCCQRFSIIFQQNNHGHRITDIHNTHDSTRQQNQITHDI